MRIRVLKMGFWRDRRGGWALMQVPGIRQPIRATLTPSLEGTTLVICGHPRWYSMTPSEQQKIGIDIGIAIAADPRYRSGSN